MDDKNSHAPPKAMEPRKEPVARISRRTMLSQASKAAIPVVVTLYSGTSSGTGKAVSSNLISVDSTPGAEGGKWQCLDTDSVYPVPNKSNVYDLGSDPMAHVTRISDANWYRSQSTSNPVSEKKMCEEGGYFYKRSSSGNYSKRNIKKGVLCSATAVSSFSKKITYTDV